MTRSLRSLLPGRPADRERSQGGHQWNIRPQEIAATATIPARPSRVLRGARVRGS
jgi:hypothetical protein